MNRAVVDQIVQAVLYEGYNLYPYRPSVKNRCRWTFGGLYPRWHSDASQGTDAWSMQVQCLVEGGPDAALEVTVRYLHLMQRTVGVLTGDDSVYEPVESLQLGDTCYQTWQEAVEREVTIGPLPLASLLASPSLLAQQQSATGSASVLGGSIIQDAASRQQESALAEPVAPVVQTFTAPASRAVEPLRGPGGRIAALLIREQQAIEGAVEVSAQRLDGSAFRVTVRVFNRAVSETPCLSSREEALMRTLVAANVLLVAREGTFCSLTDPPETLREATAGCRNHGVWPVLIGAPGENDAMLAAPIILYDHIRIAPESPGDLFDGTEIDEILTLRIMTLTEEEKSLAGAIDDRTRRLLARTESLARQQLAGLHGAIRGLEPVAQAESAHQDGGDPFAAPPGVASIRVDDVELRPGDRVRLRPGMGGDIFDLALSGKIATIESIEQDYDDQFHVAVTVDDDPGQDLGRAREPGHRFFFKPEEIAPLDPSGAGP